MKIAVVETGYVGLVAGTCFAETGHSATCVDKDEACISLLKGGELPFYEPGLAELVARNTEEGRLQFTSDLAQAVRDCLVVFLCVGTPPAEDGAADLSDALDGSGPLTLFAPTDAAFANLPAGTVETLLLPENKDGSPELEPIIGIPVARG